MFDVFSKVYHAVITSEAIATLQALLLPDARTYHLIISPPHHKKISYAGALLRLKTQGGGDLAAMMGLMIEEMLQ